MDELKKYRIIKELGSQKKRKFGKVYLIEHRENGSKAILKQLDKQSNKHHILDCLRTESEFSFDFKGLPKTLAFVETENEFFLLKSHLEGVPLNEFWLTVPRKQRLETLKQLFQQLSPIMNYLAEKQIAHCDLKPSNILVNKHEQGIDVSIIDFGLALHFPYSEERQLLFPLGFAAPELILNELSLVDQRADYFALGIVIWRLFEGKLPLTHTNPSIFTNLLINHPLPEGDYMPKKLMQLVNVMCSKHAFQRPPNQLNANERKQHLLNAINKRPSTMDELMEALNQIEEKRWFFF